MTTEKLIKLKELLDDGNLPAAKIIFHDYLTEKMAEKLSEVTISDLVKRIDGLQAKVQRLEQQLNSKYMHPGFGAC